MSTPVKGPNTVTPVTPGEAIIAIDPAQGGGYIVNPLDAADQGNPLAAPLYIDQVKAAVLAANDTTIALQPGQSYAVIPNTTTGVSVASPNPNHRFTAVQWTLP
jgi:hypothetical protein